MKKKFFFGLSMVVCLGFVFMSSGSFAQDEKKEITGEETKRESSPVDMANVLISEGKFVEAEKILKEFISTMPASWKPIIEKQDTIEIYFWDQDEFVESSVNYAKFTNTKKKIVWPDTPSYSRAFYFLTFMATEQGNYEQAMSYIDKAIALEPDHPTLLAEKALALGQLKQDQEAYELYMRAFNVRPWATASQRARALRGAGVELVNLDRLDEAESLLKKSLEFAPGNSVAQDELSYISDLRKGGQKVPGGIITRTK